MTNVRDQFIVGLTGGIGSGKSSVGDVFAKLGAFVIDADALSHSLTVAHGRAIGPIDTAFPGVVQDGVLNRALLRERVFNQPDERRRLEAILHPMIRAATQTAISTVEARNAPYIVHMVPLLFESPNYADRIDCAVVVDVDEDTQVERVTRTRHLDAASVRKIIASQMPRTERLRRAQFVIDNSGPQALLEPQVQALHHVFLANAGRVAATHVRAVEVSAG
jgi:dephospho-CoA kinase